jgi:uncharacterized protein (TIGR02145 family)
MKRQSKLNWEATAKDNFGKIIKWEWNIGNANAFVETTPNSNYIAVTPSVIDSRYPCVLKVTNNIMKTALDTVFINIVEDIPIPTIKTTTDTISINDSIKLFGSAIDMYGTIVKWEWDIGNKGVFVESDQNHYAAIGPSTVNKEYPCILKITDDDGNIAFDTCTITIVPDVPIPKASTTTPTVLINDSIQLKATATDFFGTIKKWEWKIGNSPIWTLTSKSDTTIVAPATEQSYLCSLRVTDDDGFIGFDAININVYYNQNILKDIEGNIYGTVKIGKQIWTVENIRTTKYNDGTSIPYIIEDSIWSKLSSDAYCYYDNDEKNKYEYGALYSWYATINKKLAPNGWHVATVADWDTLQNYLIVNGYNWDGTTAGNKIAKSMASNSGWIPSGQIGTVGYDMQTNNRSGLTAKPGGCRAGNGGIFHKIGNTCVWWAASDNSGTYVIYRYITFGSSNFDYNLANREGGLSVRLVKD